MHNTTLHSNFMKPCPWPLSICLHLCALRPQLILSINISLTGLHLQSTWHQTIKKMFLATICSFNIIYYFIINVHCELHYVSKLHSFWCKKKLVLLWAFVTFQHNLMSCIDNLEKLRTGFNVFVMNPSGRGGERDQEEIIGEGIVSETGMQSSLSQPFIGLINVYWVPTVPGTGLEAWRAQYLMVLPYGS